MSCNRTVTGARRRPARAVTALAAAVPATAWGAAIQADAGVDVTALLRLTLGLAVVVAAIFGLSWLLRRMRGRAGGAGGQLRVLAVLAVGGRERIVLVQAGRTQLLVGVAPGRVQSLHVLEEPVDTEPASGSEGQHGPFADRLHQLMGRHGK